MPHYEIERKFLVKQLPKNFSLNQFSRICQGYIAVALDGTEVRVRQCGKNCFLTVKNGTGLVKLESETELTAAQFNELWPLTEGKRITKIRYRIPYSQYIIELDVYNDKLKGLVVAEVEFASVKESQNFVLPDWFGDEVTGKRAYRNQMLALYGIPQPRERVFER